MFWCHKETHLAIDDGDIWNKVSNVVVMVVSIKRNLKILKHDKIICLPLRIVQVDKKFYFINGTHITNEDACNIVICHCTC